MIIWMTIALFSSCAGPKYTYYFETGKYMDFRNGKWILNDATANKRFVDQRLYTTAKEGFQNILGDSLLEIHTLRGSKLMPPTIPFDMDSKALMDLGHISGCDYLINITAKIMSSGVGPITLFTSNDPDYYDRNESVVTIKIYHLPTGLEVSSSSVNAKLEERGSAFEDEEKLQIPRINMSSETAALKATRKLIRKYSKYSYKEKEGL